MEELAEPKAISKATTSATIRVEIRVAIEMEMQQLLSLVEVPPASLFLLSKEESWQGVQRAEN